MRAKLVKESLKEAFGKFGKQMSDQTMMMRKKPNAPPKTHISAHNSHYSDNVTGEDVFGFVMSFYKEKINPEDIKKYAKRVNLSIKQIIDLLNEYEDNNWNDLEYSEKDTINYFISAANTLKESLNEYWGMSDDYIDRLGGFEHDLFDALREISDMDEDVFYDFVDEFSDEHRGMILRLFQQKMTPEEAAEKIISGRIYKNFIKNY